MWGQILGTVGARIGGALGGGIFSTVGRFAGRMLGDYLDRSNSKPEQFQHFRNIHESFALSSAKYGSPIPLTFGSIKVKGEIIWSDEIKEVSHTTSSEQLFKGSGAVKAVHNTTICDYFLSFALAIAEGEISEIVRVWANEQLINLGEYKCRIYTGSEEQMPDPLINSRCNGIAPAFRGLAYIVFEELPLEHFGYVIPKLEFEVIRKANIQDPGPSSVEDIVKAVTIIPGSGEFVYDTIVQNKVIRGQFNINLATKLINSHNFHHIADSVHSLNQLAITCKNVEWTAPVVCWFGDSTDAGRCSIFPTIEFRDMENDYSEEWSVAGFSRQDARLISKDEEGNPKYGGTINDASIVRYLSEMKSRGYKIMLYPMFLLDVPGKPWRGHVSGDSESIADFFNKEDGYNNFILHYARLVREHVDAFVIGSELIGLTKVRDGDDFPAIRELVLLAEMVKHTVGDRVLVTYAADWSEYHHTEGGWYHLDPLWTSPHIDFIGIDAYFPVTATLNSSISPEDIIHGWQSGEGYEYFLDEDGQRVDLPPEYAWKNLSYWWSNRHQNPDSRYTEWTPRMKQIWFTEFGFPSIDKATNQPNVFFDPFCSDGGIPKHSSGAIDFSIQRKAIRAFIEFWQSQEYIGNMFLWTWDARPYPAWPHMRVWRDGYLWEKGHWINNKFGAVSLSGIILELSERCGIDVSRLNIATVDESVEGIILNKQTSIMDALNLLRIGYFFDIISNSQEKIEFIKRGVFSAYQISSQRLIKLSENTYLNQKDIAKSSIINKLEIWFINNSGEYKQSYCQISNENISNVSSMNINLPIAMSDAEAQRLGKIILRNAAIEDKVLKFIIPANSIQCQPSDFISLHYMDQYYVIRITDIKLVCLKLEITGIIDDAYSYYIPISKHQGYIEYNDIPEPQFWVLDLPFLLNESSDYPYLSCYLQGNLQYDLYAQFLDNNHRNENASYRRVTQLMPSALIGNVTLITQQVEPSIFLIDERSSFTVLCKNLSSLENGHWHKAFIGEEIISFQNIDALGNDLYEISRLIRGEFGTQHLINTHEEGERFIILEKSANIIPVSARLEQTLVEFKLKGFENKQRLLFENRSQKLPPPFIDDCFIENDYLNICWRGRSRLMDNWLRIQEEEGQYDFTICISDDNISHRIVTSQFRISIDLADLNLREAINVEITARHRSILSRPARFAINY